MGIFSKIHAYVFPNSCLCFDQNTPGISQFTPAFGDTRNRVFYENEFLLYLLISYLFLNLHIPLLGQNILKDLFYYYDFCKLFTIK